MKTAFLGLGSNLGNRKQMLDKAVHQLTLHPAIEVITVSSYIESKPVGYTNQNCFINAVAAIKTSLTPQNLLTVVKQIEEAMGRTPSVRWGPRIIDIDILLYDKLMLAEKDLTIPHPRLLERGFVLGPLAEIAPTQIIPPTNKTASELWAALNPAGGKDVTGD